MRTPIRWSRTVMAAFELGFRPWMRRRLGGIHICGLPTGLPAGTPLLFVANHTSWWDGFLVREVQRSLRPGRPLYHLVNGAELARHPFLRRIGGVDIGPRSPAALLRALRFLQAERTRDPGMSVSVFPQGRIWPAQRRPIRVKRGAAVVARLLAPVVALPMAIRFEMLATPGAHAFVSVGAPRLVERHIDTDVLARALTEELDALGAFLDRHGEGAAILWPPPPVRIARADGGVRDPAWPSLSAEAPRARALRCPDR